MEIIKARSVVAQAARRRGDPTLLAHVVNVFRRGVHVENVYRYVVRVAAVAMGRESSIGADGGQCEISESCVDLTGKSVRGTRRVVPSVDAAVDVVLSNVDAASGEAGRQQTAGRGGVPRPWCATPADEVTVVRNQVDADVGCRIPFEAPTHALAVHIVVSPIVPVVLGIRRLTVGTGNAKRRVVGDRDIDDTPANVVISRADIGVTIYLEVVGVGCIGDDVDETGG